MKKKASGETKTLRVVNFNYIRSWAGKIFWPTSDRPYAEIRLNSCWLGAANGSSGKGTCQETDPGNWTNFDVAEEKTIGAHEFGHGLNLADRTDYAGRDQLMDDTPVTHDGSQNPLAPASGDRYWYHTRWDP